MAKEMDHLAQDAMRALQAGMSYGKWKAMHPHTGDSPITSVQGYAVRKCAVCGKEMPDEGHFRKYCTPECSYQAVKKKNREYARRKKLEIGQEA